MAESLDTFISSFGLSSESSEQSGKPMANTDMKEPAPRSLQRPNSSQARSAIFWDIENCHVPTDVNPEDVARNIIMTLRLLINGGIIKFSAYGDFSTFPKRLKEGYQRTGIELVDVPNGRKNAADLAIVTSMFDFAMDNRPPLFIMFISGKFVLDWPRVARGGYLMPGLADDQHVVATPPHPLSYCLSEGNQSLMWPPSRVSFGLSSPGANAVRRGNVNVLKVQIVNLLRSSGGSLPLTSVSAKYRKVYGMRLCVSDYGEATLLDLLNKMSGDISIKGEGQEKWVSAVTDASPSTIFENDKKGEGTLRKTKFR